MDTLAQIRTLVVSGTTDIIVWGLSGTGKSRLGKKLKSVPGIHVADADSAASTSKRSTITIGVKTGVPPWLGSGQSPPGEIFHAPFPPSALARIAEKQPIHGSQSYFRTDENIRQLVLDLAALGLGSTVLVNNVVRLPYGISPATEICKFLLVTGRTSQSEDCARMFEALSAMQTDCSVPALGHETKEFLTRLTPSLVTELFRNLTLDNRKLLGIAETVFGDVPLSVISREMLAFYSRLEEFTEYHGEPAFLLRSARPLLLDEQSRILEEFGRVMPFMGFSMRCRSVVVYGSRVQMDGSLERKMGLYLFVGADRPVVDGRRIRIRTESDLQPLVTRCSESRAQYDMLYIREGKCIAPGTFIYGGGDHTLRESQSQALATVGLELIFQKLKIPYEVYRGLRENNAVSFNFDGQTLQSEGSLRWPEARYED